ncbi:MAG: hypothetical protein ACLRZ6_01625 [Lachnospiraceae bacterium]
MVSQESFMLDCAGAIVMCWHCIRRSSSLYVTRNIRLKKLGNIFLDMVVMTAGIVMISTAYTDKRQ